MSRWKMERNSTTKKRVKSSSCSRQSFHHCEVNQRGESLKSAKKKSVNNQNLFLGIAAIAIMAGIAWVSMRATNEPAEDSAVSAKAADVLSPSLFTDERTRAAYQTAKDIPEVLEQ